MSQAHALVNLFIVVGPLALGLAMGLAISNARLHPFGTATLTLALYGIGFALFVVAKVSVIRRGYVISFGSRLMSLRFRRLYRLGYGLMIVAVLLTLGLLASEKVVIRRAPAKKALERAGTQAVPRQGTSEDAGRSAPRR